MKKEVQIMKRRALNFALSSLAILAPMLNAGCARSHRGADSIFEPQPRPVLQTIGLSATWDPRLAVDTAGTLYLFAVYDQDSKSRLGLVMSENSGDTLASPIVPISEPGVSIGSHGEEGPSVVMAPSAIYALWQESSPDGSMRLMSARSLNWGQSFDKPVQVSDKNARSYRGFPSIAASPNGDVYAVWLDERDATAPQNTSSLYFAKSTDRGASFGPNVRVAEHVCPCCRPGLAFGANGEVFVAWRRVFPGDIRNVVVSASQDGGRTFAAPVLVRDDGWKINGCPDSGPALAESNGSLWIAWMTAGKDNRARIWMARSDDGGRSFREALDVSQDVLDPNHPAMKTASDGTAWLVFQGRAARASGTWSKTQAYVVQIDRTGDPSPPMPIPGSNESISYPHIAIGYGGQLYLAWSQPRNNGFTVMLSRGREKE